MDSPKTLPQTLKRTPFRQSFPVLAARLMGSIVLEGVATLCHFLLFPLLRRTEKARIRAIILRPAISLASLLLGVLLVGTGCETTQPGSSFSQQLDETAWSAKEILRMDDAQQSLEETLVDLGSGTSPKEMLWDVEQILSAPDAQASLEADLEDFGAMELDQVPETFELIGW